MLILGGARLVGHRLTQSFLVIREHGGYCTADGTVIPAGKLVALAIRMLGRIAETVGSICQIAVVVVTVRRVILGLTTYPVRFYNKFVVNAKRSCKE